MPACNAVTINGILVGCKDLHAAISVSQQVICVAISLFGYNLECSRIVGYFVNSVFVIYTLRQIHSLINATFSVTNPEAAICMGRIATPTILAQPRFLAIIISNNADGMTSAQFVVRILSKPINAIL